MAGASRSIWASWKEARAAAPNRSTAARFLLVYAALRVWTGIIGCFPVEWNLRTARLFGGIWWLLMKRHRDRALDNLRPALGDVYSEARLRDIARRSFEHFAQVYLVELWMTPRLVNPWSWSRYVEWDDLGPALRELLKDRGTIMITAHFGNFELLGHTITRLGLPLTAIMRPLDDPLINEYLESSRAAHGLRLLHKKNVMQAAEKVVADRETLCFIADQDAGRKGIFAEFFNRKASWYKSIGLLAMLYRVPIVVGQAARIRRDSFRYRIEVERIIQPEEWSERDDPLMWITETFARALETGIRRWPEQYLWMHRRWKHRPKEERTADRRESA